MELAFTGERYVPEIGGELRLEHVHRYAFCRPFLKDKVVLDVACGEGYGSAMLAASAARVVGVDISEEAVAHARLRYGHLGNLEYRVGDAAALDLPAASVDVLVSFETIEHLQAQEEMMAGFARVLKPNGLLILSSPDKRTYSDEPGYHNEFHVKELYLDELGSLVGRHFKRHLLLGQRLAGGSSIFALSEDTPSRRPALLVDDGNGVLDRAPRMADATYAIVLATNGKQLPTAQPSTLLSEVEDPLLKLKAVAKWASGVHEDMIRLTAAHQGALDQKDDQLAEVNQALRATQERLQAQEELRHSEVRAMRDELVAHSAQRLRALEGDLQSQRQLASAAQARADALAQALQQAQAAANAAESEALSWQAATQASHEAALQNLQSQVAGTQAEAQVNEATLRLALQTQTAACAELEAQVRLAAVRESDAALALAHQQTLVQQANQAQQHALEHGRTIAEQLSESQKALAQQQQAQVATLQAALGQAAAAHAQAMESVDRVALESQERQAMEHAKQTTALMAQIRDLQATQQTIAAQHQAELARLDAAFSAARQADADLLAQAQQRSEHEAQAAQARLAELEATWCQRLADIESHWHERHGGDVAQWTSRLATTEALQQQALQDCQAIQRAWQAEQTEWAARWTQADADHQAAVQALRAEGDARLAVVEQTARAELAWWRHEVTDARRQLQQQRLSQHRQNEAAARGLQQLQRQHLQTQEKLQVALQAAAQALQPLNQGLGSQLESLRLGLGRDQLDTLATQLQQLRQQALAASAALRDALPVLPMPAHGSAAISLASLMALDDEAFVRAAYLAVLGREADPSGHDHYLQRLGGGEQRLRVLSDLRRSPEGQARTPDVDGLDGALQALRKRRLPWAGRAERQRLLQLLTPPPLASPSAADAGTRGQLNRLEQSVEALGRGSALLAEAVPIAVALGRAPREFGLDPWACAQELVRAADAAFIDLAHGLLLRRSPDATEHQRALQRLSAGTSRVHVIDLLLEQATRGGVVDDAETGAHRSRALLALGGAHPLACAEQPEVSIIVAVHGHLDRSLRCLQALQRHTPNMAFEVIVVDDGSPDHSANVLAQVPGIRLERRSTSGGLAAAFNSGARVARGEWLHLLRQDVEVHAGWLDELRRTFDIFPGTGAAGSRLLQPDGTLLSHGRVVWQDGCATDLGQHAPSNAPAWGHARTVDACMAASLLVPRVLYEAIGGLPEDASLAGVEDRTLALALAERGYRTVSQALSTVTCHQQELPDSTTDEAAVALHDRHGALLQAHPRPGSPLDQAAQRRQVGQLLAIEHRLPRPDRDAGSVSVFNMLMAARELGLQVSLIAEADLTEGVAHQAGALALLQRSGVQVLTAPQVRSVAEHLSAVGASLSAVLLYRPVVMERYAALVQRLCPQAKLLYYPHDLHFLRLARQAQATGNPKLAAEAHAQQPRELALHRMADQCILASTAEVALVTEAGLGGNARWLPLLLDCTRGTRPAALRQGMLFVGGFHHAPNVHALHLLLEDIMPRVRAHRPDLRLWVVGEAPPANLVARQDLGVEYCGAVDDLAPWLERAKVAVAPLKFGAGAKGKVARPMAAGLPVVATSEAVEGMALEADRHLLLADNADAFAEAVLRLHEDDALWLRLADAAHSLALQQWGPKAASANLAKILQEVDVPVGKTSFGTRFFREPLFMSIPRTPSPERAESAATAAS